MAKRKSFSLILGAALFALLTLGLLWQETSNTSGHHLRRSDGREYTRIAFNFLHYGVFHDAASWPEQLASGRSTEYMRREPGYPLYLAGLFLTVPDFRTLDIQCILEDDHCAAAFPLLRRVLEAEAALGAVLVALTFVAGYVLLRSWPLSIGVGLLVMLLLPLEVSGNRLIAIFLLVHVLLALEMWRRPRILAGAISGLALGLLVLTEAVFQYWFIAVAVLGLTGLWWDAERRRVLARPLAAMLVMALALSLPWMVRNYVEMGRFAIADRKGEVLAIRASAGGLTWPEVRGALVYYLPINPERTGPLVQWLEPETFGYLRLDQSNPESYGHRVVSFQHMNDLKKRLFERTELLTPGWSRPGDIGVPHWTSDNRLAQNAALERASLDLMREDWPKHLVLTVAFAGRGSRFVCHDYGSAMGAYGPVVGYPAKLGCLTGRAMSLLFLPAFALMLFLAWKRRDFALAFLLLPVAWAFGIHAVATEFQPRFAMPLIPVFALSFALAVHEVWHWSKKRVRRLSLLPFTQNRQ